MRQIVLFFMGVACLGCEAKVVTTKVDPIQQNVYPDGYRGWAYVVYDVAGTPALPRGPDGRTEIRYPADGCLLTSSASKNTKDKGFVYVSGEAVPRVDPKSDDAIGLVRAESRVFVGVDKTQRHFDISFIGTTADAKKTKRGYKGGYPCRAQLEALKTGRK